MRVYKLIKNYKDKLFSFNMSDAGFLDWEEKIAAVRYEIRLPVRPQVNKLFALNNREFGVDYMMHTGRFLSGSKVELYLAEADISQDQSSDWVFGKTSTWFEFEPHTVFCDSITLLERIR